MTEKGGRVELKWEVTAVLEGDTCEAGYRLMEGYEHAVPDEDKAAVLYLIADIFRANADYFEDRTGGGGAEGGREDYQELFECYGCKGDFPVGDIASTAQVGHNPTIPIGGITGIHEVMVPLCRKCSMGEATA